MRRGLMQWNPQELPLSALDARIAQLRQAMASAGFDAFLIYTNIVRPAAVTYLTGFTPYWSEGLLLVPSSGRLLFATALSNRVADWIRSTNPVSEVVSTPKPGSLLGERLAGDASVKRVGMLELDLLPSGHFDELAAAAPKVAWVDGSTLFASLRRTIDDAERGLLKRADALARAALGEIDARSITDAGALAASLERHVRLAGAEEVYVALAPDLAADRRLLRVTKPAPLADRFAARLSVAYKGSWVRRTRTFARDNSTKAADGWFTRTVGSFEAGKPLAEQLSERIAVLPSAKLASWMAEGCLSSYPFAVVASSDAPGAAALTDGGFLVLSAKLVIDGVPWTGAAPLIVGRPNL